MLGKKRKMAVCVSHALFGSAVLAAGLPLTALGAEPEVAVVTVTAQGRRQEAQSVPIPFQIVTGDQLDKLAATDLSAMNGYIPGLNVDGSQPTQPIYFLRGIGTRDFGIGTDSPVGVYVDGVYTGKSGGALMNFNDVQRIEVLKGPQGTLFGRNSAGGAISIVTNEPGKQREAEAHVRLGNHGQRYLDGLLNVPLGDSAALRVSVVGNRSDGWLTDAGSGAQLNGEHNWGSRATLLWNGAERSKVLLSWEHEDLNQPARPAHALMAQAAPGAAPAFPIDPAGFIDPRSAPVYNDVPGGSKESRRFDGVSLRVERPLGWADFTSTTAYRHFNSFNREDEDGTARSNSNLDTANIESNTSWQQEFKLSGKNARADWVVGASAYGETAHQTSQINTTTDTLDTLFNNVAGLPVYSMLDGALQQAGLPLRLLGNAWQENMLNKGTYRAYAVYGDVIWHMSAQLNLTTGARLTRDEKQFSWFNPNRSAGALDASLGALAQYDFLPSLVQAGAISPDQLMLIQGLLTQNQLLVTSGATGAPLVRKSSWNDISPRVVLDYRVTPDMMLYSSITKGYQAGGYNSVAVAGGYAPEKVWNYEAGIKSNFRDLNVVFNASLFAYKFSDLQSLSLVPNGSSVPAYQVTSSDQQAHGLDLELRWQPQRDTRLYLTGEYIDQSYKNYVANDGVDLTGQPVGTPRLTAAAGIDITWRNLAGGKVDLTLQHAYTGATRCNADSVAQGQCLSAPTFSVGAAHHRSDARLAWSASDGHWGVAGYVNNLFDQRSVYNVNNIAAAFGSTFASVSPPRAFGLELNIRM